MSDGPAAARGGAPRRSFSSRLRFASDRPPAWEDALRTSSTVSLAIRFSPHRRVAALVRASPEGDLERAARDRRRKLPASLGGLPATGRSSPARTGPDYTEPGPSVHSAHR